MDRKEIKRIVKEVLAEMGFKNQVTAADISGVATTVLNDQAARIRLTRSGGSLSIPSGSDVDMDFDTVALEIEDWGVTVPEHTIIVPQAGRYLFLCHVQWAGPNIDTELRLYLNKNGDANPIDQDRSTCIKTGERQSQSVMIIDDAAQGDSYSIEVRHNQGSNTSILGTEEGTHFDAMLIPGT